MAEIEFLDPPPPVAPLPAALPGTAGARPGPRRGRVVRPGLSVLLLLAAAALAVLAPFQTVYSVAFGRGAGGFHFAVDGWGRYGGGGVAVALEQAPRYGIVFVACAALFALAALLNLVAATRSPRLLRVALAAGLLAVGAMAALLASIALETQSVLTSARATVHDGVVNGDPIQADLRTAVGRCIVVGIAAGVCALLALALGYRRTPVVPPAAHPPAPVQVADEELHD